MYCREREDRKFYFPCNQWLAKDEGDGLVVRQLTATTDSSAAFEGHQFTSKTTEIIGHFRNAKGTGAEMYPAINSGIVTGEARFSY